MIQTAFELLSSVVLVEQEKMLGTSAQEKLTAEHKIHLLLYWAGIPRDIPSKLSDLSTCARSENWSNTAAAMTQIRNFIIHPKKNNREKLARYSLEVMYEAMRLGLWNLELCLLRLFNYNERYANRITREWAGETDTVPWKN